MPKIKGMKNHINLEDNIFVLNIRLRMVHDTLILDTDEELFLTKTMDDLGFIDSNLSTLLARLQENLKFVGRSELFVNLAGTEQQFREVLHDFCHGKGNLSALRYPELQERALLWSSHSHKRQEAIEKLITDSKQQDAELLVGQNELQELLSR
jgi:hypothetical protein